MNEQSLRTIEPITPEQAQSILSDSDLQGECLRLGLDLGLLVENLLSTSDVRFRRHQNALRMALAFRHAGEEARKQ